MFGGSSGWHVPWCRKAPLAKPRPGRGFRPDFLKSFLKEGLPGRSREERTHTKSHEAQARSSDQQTSPWRRRHCSMHEQARSSRAQVRPLDSFEGAGATRGSLGQQIESRVICGLRRGHWHIGEPSVSDDNDKHTRGQVYPFRPGRDGSGDGAYYSERDIGNSRKSKCSSSRRR
jgi:hypothetical protein